MIETITPTRYHITFRRDEVRFTLDRDRELARAFDVARRWTERRLLRACRPGGVAYTEPRFEVGLDASTRTASLHVYCDYAPLPDHRGQAFLLQQGYLFTYEKRDAPV